MEKIGEGESNTQVHLHLLTLTYTSWQCCDLCDGQTEHETINSCVFFLFNHDISIFVHLDSNLSILHAHIPIFLKTFINKRDLWNSIQSQRSYNE
jgi:hypothetical protein